MKNNQDALLTDEELDNVVGGRTYEYEYVRDPEGKGDYYKCTTCDGDTTTTMCISVDEWDKWINNLNQGDTIINVGKK